MSVYGEDKERELHDRLSDYIHGGADYNNAEELETNPPGSPDPLFDGCDSPGPSNIASAFAAAASGPVTRSRSALPAPSQGLAEVEFQVGAEADNDGWTSTDSTASRAGSVHPDAGFAAGTGGTGGGARRVGYGGGGRSAARGAQSVGFGRGGEDPMSAEQNTVVNYTCWSCGSIVSLRKKEMIVMCDGCGGRIVMKLRPQKRMDKIVAPVN
ncbi:unnamed protein product [Tuber aestivum]|uniref:Uncharacterized protein n=1 Tax=Tuber aestivum TaxID=59557 RepID=A0A292Q552_9PEZI|nr:unnamed protein product [Tuber aestivum]